jgi:hypothetical protein
VTFARDPESAPQPGQVALGAALVMGGNVLLLGLALWVSRAEGLLGDLGGMFFVFQGLLQWIYLVPVVLLLRHRRGLWLGILLGAALYTMGSCGCMLTLLRHTPD